VNWKIPGWAAAAGAVVSLAAGLAGGNGFGTILLRALVSALIAGALGFGAQHVLRRFLPDFGSSKPLPAVDILIDEEVPLAAEASRGRVEEALSEELGAAPEEGLGLEEGGGAGLGVSGGEPGLAEEEPFPKPPEAGSFEPPADGLLGLAEAGESPEPVEGAEELPPGEPLEVFPVEGQKGSGLAELDVVERGPPSHRSLKAGELEAQLEDVTKGQDPASLAKAVRTFLRKDQEG
jgi:hypothetical protein